MKAARLIFLLAGLYGIGVLLPDYFTAKWLGAKISPANHASRILLRICGRRARLPDYFSGDRDESCEVSRADAGLRARKTFLRDSVRRALRARPPRAAHASHSDLRHDSGNFVCGGLLQDAAGRAHLKFHRDFVKNQQAVANTFPLASTD